MAQASRSTFGKYVLLRKLASGGMGEIFLAKQRGPSGFEKLLVIKRILSHHLDKKDYLDMFFSEARLVARLNHGNIIQIQEMGEIDGDYYIAMEYVRGKSLRDVVDELRAEGSQLPLPHVIDLAIKLADGLGYAHQARDIRGRPMNIVHRDINPHNILVSYGGDLKLIDFGIAKSEMTSVHTATGTIKGKFVYMSPEQSAADPIDSRSDIFSLGIVLYEMTTLENPFVRQNVVLSLEAIQRQEVPPPSAKRPDAGPLDALLMKALAKRPEDRFQTAHELRDELRNLLRDQQVRPAEEDLDAFLHRLFAADIAEEDRLIAEADQAAQQEAGEQRAVEPRALVAPPPETPALRLLDVPARPTSSPLVHAPFSDEEPTLAGEGSLRPLTARAVPARPAHEEPAYDDEGETRIGPEGPPVRAPSRERSRPGASPAVEEAAASLGAEDEEARGSDALAPEGPTRSGRAPRSHDGRLDEPEAFEASSGPDEEPLDEDSPDQTWLPPAALRSDVPARPAAPFAELLGGQGLPSVPLTDPMLPASPGGLSARPTSAPRGERLSPTPALSPALRRALEDRPASTSNDTDEDDRRALPPPSAPFQRFGRLALYLAVLAVTTVAGFQVTRLVIGPADDPGSTRAPIPPVAPLQPAAAVVAPPEPVASADAGPVPAPVPVAEPGPDEEVAPPSKAVLEEARPRPAERAPSAARVLPAEPVRQDPAPPPPRVEPPTKTASPARVEVIRPAPEPAPSPVAVVEPAPAPAPAPAPPSAAEAPEPKRTGSERLGTLTLRTSGEVTVEVDGRPVGTSPSSVNVRRSEGKLRLSGEALGYAVTLEYAVTEGGVTVRVDATPWAIVKRDGISLGRTPQGPLVASTRHQLELLRPGQPEPFSVTLLWTARP